MNVTVYITLFHYSKNGQQTKRTSIPDTQAFLRTTERGTSKYSDQILRQMKKQEA